MNRDLIQPAYHGSEEAEMAVWVNDLILLIPSQLQKSHQGEINFTKSQI